MFKTKKLLIPALTLFILLVPVLSFADSWPLVTCKENCGWNEFMALINKVINFILFDMALPIAAIMFAYAGFLLVTAGGGEAKTKAKEIFTNTVLGLVIAVAAWLIVSTILSILGYDGTWIGLKIGV